MIFLNNNYYRDIPTNPLYNGNIQNNNIYYENIDNLLNLNKGKKITIYYNDKTFKGILESSFIDYIIISNPSTGNWYILLNKYINYIEFNEQINNFYLNR